MREHAATIFAALSPEGENVKRLRSSYVLKMKHDTLTIRIGGADLTAFKATLNTILKSSDLAVKVAHG